MDFVRKRKSQNLIKYKRGFGIDQWQRRLEILLYVFTLKNSDSTESWKKLNVSISFVLLIFPQNCTKQFPHGYNKVPHITYAFVPSNTRKSSPFLNHFAPKVFHRILCIFSACIASRTLIASQYLYLFFSGFQWSWVLWCAYIYDEIHCALYVSLFTSQRDKNHK